MKLKIIEGNTLQEIKQIEDESIDLCITSPPYWGLRDYGIEDQLGLENTMEEYLENSMKWIREVFRVLKTTGSFVLNIGDCFLGGGRGGSFGASSAYGSGKNTNVPKPPDWHKLKKYGTTDWKANSTPVVVNASGHLYKPKQFLSVSSFMYCRIVSKTDFICRGEHIWCKPNVPSPIRSRLKQSHEKLFWFVKDADKYYFDGNPWLKKVTTTSLKRGEDEYARGNINLSPSSCLKSGGGKAVLPPDHKTIEHSWRIIPVGAKQSGFELEKKTASEHIAPFPEELIRPYIISMCQIGGNILDPFLGSGTTMRVAMENNRNCIGIELKKEYIDYAKKRLNWGRGLNVEYEG